MTLARTAVFLPLLGAGAAPAQEQVAFGTNWLAQAEHGGFYQSVADGTYEECGLEVEIVPGGPQVNNRALMMAGRLDFYMGGNILPALNAVAEGIPIVVVAAIFQKDPQAILAHPGAADSWEDLKDLTLLISDLNYASSYQWMMSAHGFTAEQREPYLFNPAPFIADPGKAMQGYVTSEPYAIQREAGWTPDAFLLADHGFADYSTTIETMADTVETRPEVVRCFVEGSIRGWYTYLHGDRTGADAMILEANPEMTQDRIDYAVERMKAEGILESGDALELGIGALTEERVGDFYRKMVDAGVVPDGVDWRASFTTEFVNEGVGLGLAPAQ